LDPVDVDLTAAIFIKDELRIETLSPYKLDVTLKRARATPTLIHEKSESLYLTRYQSKTRF